MYISKAVLVKLLDTMQSVDVNIPKDKRISYQKWNIINRAGRGLSCMECNDDYCDSDNEIQVTSTEKGYEFTCHSCGDSIIIKNEILEYLIDNRHIAFTQLKTKLREFIGETRNKNDLDVTKVEPVQITNKSFPMACNKKVELGTNGTKILKIEEENNNMMNSNKMFKGLDFGKANKDLYRLSHLGLAIKNAEGTFVSYDTANQELVDVDLFDFDLDGMIYKMPVAHNQIKTGDIIVHNGKSVIVEATKNNGRIMVIDPVQGEAKDIMPTKNMFGFNFFTKILCLMDMSNLGASNDNPFGSMMPMMMMSAMGDGKSGDNDMMKMMMMSQMMSGNSQMGDMFSNPMMMMAMMSGDGKMGDMLPMMMMMQGGMFGQPQKQEKEIDTKEV